MPSCYGSYVWGVELFMFPLLPPLLIYLSTELAFFPLQRIKYKLGENTELGTENTAPLMTLPLPAFPKGPHLQSPNVFMTSKKPFKVEQGERQAKPRRANSRSRGKEERSLAQRSCPTAPRACLRQPPTWAHREARATGFPGRGRPAPRPLVPCVAGGGAVLGPGIARGDLCPWQILPDSLCSLQ